MSRSRKDDSRFQGSSGPGLQSSPYRDLQYQGTSTGLHSPSTGSHNYARSKAADRDKTGYLNKERVKFTNSATVPDSYSATSKQAAFRSPVLNDVGYAESAVNAQELSWADQVEMTLANSGSQKHDTNCSSTEGSSSKMMNSPEPNVIDGSGANQNPVEETQEHVYHKNADVQPPSNNGKTRQASEKDPDSSGYRRANCPQPRRGSRKKTLSLNPEEREALESLIEDVLNHGVNESESGSSEDDTERPDARKNANVEEGGTGAPGNGGELGNKPKSSEKGKMVKKGYPGQLKVALKHMTDLPPRFSRKLKKAEKYMELNSVRNSQAATGKIEEEDEESLAAAREDKRLSVSPRPGERDKEKTKSKEHHVREFKRSIRTLLTDLDQYVDEKSVSTNPNSVPSVHPPGAIICEDLERETLNRQASQNPDVACEVPSTVQNLLLAVKVFTTMDANQSMSPQEQYQESCYQENESSPSVTHLPNKAFSPPEMMSQRYPNTCAMQEPTGNPQFLMNVPEYVPKAVTVSTYHPQEMMSPSEQHHLQQYPPSMLLDQSVGGTSMSGGESVTRHNMVPEHMLVMSQNSPHLVTSSTVGEPLSSSAVDFTSPLLPTFGTSQAGPMGDKMMPPMPPAFVSNGLPVPLTTLPSPSSMPFYQFQSQNPPPTSFGFPIQVPYSSSQYCFIPHTVAPQSLPPPPHYGSREQTQPYVTDNMQFKTVVPDWGYQKSKQQVNTMATPSTYSNLTTNINPYVGNDPAPLGGGHFNANFRQRKRQPGSSLSPRNANNNLANASAGKLGFQRARGNDNSQAVTRTGLRPGQENKEANLHPDGGVTLPAYGDASAKRLPFTARSRSGDGQQVYPGRRDTRNFVSEKYAAQRTFAGDGKKETRHVTLKPKQAKPNRSVARSRNDGSVAQTRSLRAYHPSDLSEEGLESPDNFGDVESGADDWSTDNYDQEVSKKAKGENDVNDAQKLNDSKCVEENTVVDAASSIPEENFISKSPDNEQKVDEQDNICADESGSVHLIPSSQSKVESTNELEVSATVPESSLMPSVDELVEKVSEVSLIDEYQPVYVEEEVVKELEREIEVDGVFPSTENVKRVTVPNKLVLSVTNFGLDLENVNCSPFELPSAPDHHDPVDVELSCSPQVSAEADNEDVPLCQDAPCVDIDLPDAVADAVPECQETTSEGISVILGSKFISQLMNLFNPDQVKDAFEAKSFEAVHLSRDVLHQIYLEYSVVDQKSSESQNITRSSEEVEVKATTATSTPSPVENNSSMIDGKTLDDGTGCDINESQVSDSSIQELNTHETCDNCTTEDVVECDDNSISPC